MTDEPKSPTQRDVEATVKALDEAFNLTAAEKKQMLLAFKKEKYEALCEVNLVPRFAVYNGDQFWDRRQRRLLTADQVDSDAEVVREFGYRGNSSPTAPHTLLVRSENAVHVHGVQAKAGSTDEFVAGPGPNGAPIKMINTWRPSELHPAPAGAGDPVEWLVHQEWMVEDPAELAWWLDWQAFKLQRPEAYSPLAPFLLGDPGNGKDMSVGLFAALVGSHNVAKIGMWRLGSPYDEFLASQYVYVEEMTFGGKAGAELYDRFKGWTGAPRGAWMDINPKMQGMRQALVQPTFMFTSNSDTALMHVTTDDRRLCCVGCSGRRNGAAEGVGSAAWFDSLAQLYADKAYQARVLRWLLARDVSQFHPQRELLGATRQRYLVAALYDGSAEAYDLVTDGRFRDRRVFSFREVHMALSQRWHSRAVTAGLERAGCIRLKRGQAAGSRDTIYAGANLEPGQVAVLGRMSTHELGALLKAEMDDWLPG